MKRWIRVFPVLVILAALILPLFQGTPTLADDFSPPILDKDRDYYQVIFPIGLRYSSSWAGTFSYVPNGMQQVLFDDTWTDDWVTITVLR